MDKSRSRGESDPLLACLFDNEGGNGGSGNGIGIAAWSGGMGLRSGWSVCWATRQRAGLTHRRLH